MLCEMSIACDIVYELTLLHTPQLCLLGPLINWLWLHWILLKAIRVKGDENKRMPQFPIFLLKRIFLLLLILFFLFASIFYLQTHWIKKLKYFWKINDEHFPTDRLYKSLWIRSVSFYWSSALDYLLAVKSWKDSTLFLCNGFCRVLNVAESPVQSTHH